MIQEKDFLYRVPVKTAPITTPGGQIRNPEILVDVEGGEFMHGNILDANSTNKLINQSVDDKITEGGYVTKNLLDAETARATAKENEIKAQVDIINGDSTTEGSFRKAIADVVAAAPEDLDTLKEIADKLAGNDDLHTALNQAITEKADASALLNEVTRATGAESGLQAAIATKADATALSNYVLTTALNKQVDTLNAAISAKQDAGNYIPYDASIRDSYQVDKTIAVKANDVNTAAFGPNSCIRLKAGDTNTINIDYSGISLKVGDHSFTLNPSKIAQVGYGYAFDVNTSEGVKFSEGESFAKITPSGFFSKLYSIDGTSSIDINTSGISLTDCGDNILLSRIGLILPNGDNNHVLTSNGSTINIAEYATKADLSSQINPKADRSDLMALEQKVTANTTAIEGKQDAGNYVTYNSKDDDGYYFDKFFTLNDGQLAVSDGTEVKTTITGAGISIDSPSANNESIEINGNGVYIKYGDYSMVYDGNGINSLDRPDCVPITDGTLKPLSDFALKTDIATLPTNIVTASAVSDRYFGFEKAIEIYSEAINKIMTIGYTGINFQTNKNDVAINEDGFFISSDSDDTDLCSFTTSGIKFAGKTSTDIPTANGTFINITEQIDHAVNDYNFISQQQADYRYALADTFDSLSAGLSAKQNKITVNSVDVTDIETADAEKLRTIVTNLTNALSESGLIRLVENVE